MASDPGPSVRSAVGGSFASPFMPRRRGAVQRRREGDLGAARGAGDLPALSLPPLRDASLHLRAMRLREPLLPRGIARGRFAGNLCAAPALATSPPRGAHRHAERQRRYREPQRQEVTHQRCPLVTNRCSVSRHLLSANEAIDVDSKEPPRPPVRLRHTRGAFSGRRPPALPGCTPGGGVGKSHAARYAAVQELMAHTHPDMTRAYQKGAHPVGVACRDTAARPRAQPDNAVREARAVYRAAARRGVRKHSLSESRFAAQVSIQ